jgi:hypothetical protein
MNFWMNYRLARGFGYDVLPAIIIAISGGRPPSRKDRT